MAGAMANSASELGRPAAPRPSTEAAEATLQALFRAGLDPVATVVLVGSAARGTRTPHSDIDLLILDEDGARVTLPKPGEVHLQQDSRSGFLRRLTDRDDYPAWALRLGVPLRDADGWWAKQVAAERAKPHWPNWHLKVDYAKRRLQLAAELLETGDDDAAGEELLLAASHVARAVLLKTGVFPLSRPELPDQLEAVDAELAGLLRQLIFGDGSPVDLPAAMSMLSSKLARLAEAHSVET